MSSEIRANTLKNRVGLSTINITNTGIVVSGISTLSGNCSFAGNNVTMTASGSPNSLNVSGTSRFEIASMENALLDGEIAHTGDTDTNIRFPADDQIQLDTGGTNYLKLHRYSSVNFVEVGATANISFADNGTSTRNILIGDGNASSTGALRLQAGGGSSGFGGGIVMYSHANSTNAGGVYIGKSAGSSGSIIFGNGGTAPSNEYVRIDSNGKFGIGMNSDQQTALKGKLDIDASGIDAAGDTDDPNDYAIVIRNPSTTNQGNGIAFTNDSGANVGGAIIHIDKGTNNIGDLAFYTAATSNTPLERLRITSAGQVNFGTSATLKAIINESAINGHQFISQCTDNNNGFEIYQQHGSSTTRNTLAVYDNRSGSKIDSLLIRGDGVKITRSRGGNYARTYEFNYNDGAPGGVQTKNLATVANYGDSTSAVAEVSYVGVYGTANNYIYSGMWICGVRRASNNSAWNQTANETAAGGNQSEASLDIRWSSGVLQAVTVGPWMGWTVNVRITIINGDITVNV